MEQVFLVVILLEIQVLQSINAETFFAQIASSGLAPSTCADVAGDAAFSLTPEAESAADNNGKRATSNESAQHERMLICSTNLAKTPNQHRAFRELQALPPAATKKGG